MDPTQESKPKKEVIVLAPRQGGSPWQEPHGSVYPQHQPREESSPAAANPAISPDAPRLLIYSCEGEGNRAATGLLSAPRLSLGAGEPEQQRKAQGEEYSGAHWKKTL